MSSILSNSCVSESPELTSTYENLYGSSMFPTIIEQYYYDYQYNPVPIPTFNYSGYSTNNYNISSYQSSTLLVPSQEQMVSNTLKIHINPFFRPRSSNQTNKSSFEIKQQPQQQNNSSLSSRSRSRSHSRPADQQLKKRKTRLNSPSSSRSRSRSRSHSPPTDRQLKKRENRQNRKAQQTKFRQERELIVKNRSLLLSSSKTRHHHSSTGRWEHTEEKLNRLYKQYSNEDPFTQWEALSLKNCFELYEYAFEKYYRTTIDN